MNREELLAFDRKHLWHPLASISAPPAVNLARRGKGDAHPSRRRA